MKRKLISLFIVFIMSLGVTGCVNGTLDVSGTNTSTGTNTSSGTNDNSTIPNYSPSELEKNITCSGAITELGKLVVFATNNNKIPVDMEIEVEFYDANGIITGSSSNSLQAVGSRAEIAVEMWSTPEYFDNYKIYVDVEQTDEISYFDKLELTHNNNGDEIVVQVKNNSDDTIDYITVSVVYYQGNKVVGIDDSIEDDIKSGRSGNFKLNFPYNKNYKDVRFDSYKVFITEAYSYNW